MVGNQARDEVIGGEIHLGGFRLRSFSGKLAAAIGRRRLGRSLTIWILQEWHLAKWLNIYWDVAQAAFRKNVLQGS